jgi:putative transcriptional regulator
MDLKLEREKKLLTQKQLADLIGVDRSLISKIESGVSAPSVVTAKKIAAVLGFHWTKFFETNDAETFTGGEEGEKNHCTKDS